MIYRTSSNSSRPGFSLIELMAVLAIVGVVTAAVTIRWSSIYARAKAQSDITRLQDFEAKTRLHLLDRRLPGRLTYNFEKNVVAGTRWSNGQPKIITFKLSNSTTLVGSKGLDTSQKKRPVIIGADGSTDSYALELKRSGGTVWLLFVGQTGQSMVLEDEEQVDARL